MIWMNEIFIGFIGNSKIINLEKESFQRLQHPQRKRQINFCVDAHHQPSKSDKNVNHFWISETKLVLNKPVRNETTKYSMFNKHKWRHFSNIISFILVAVYMYKNKYLGVFHWFQKKKKNFFSFLIQNMTGRTVWDRLVFFSFSFEWNGQLNKTFVYKSS